MRPVVTAITIRATPERVWDVLTDFDHYGEWSVFISEIAGAPTLGSPLRVVLSPKASPAPRSGRGFRPRSQAGGSRGRATWGTPPFSPGRTSSCSTGRVAAGRG